MMDSIVDFKTCIPNEDKLYYRVHSNDYQDGELVHGAFKTIGAGMSTDWSQFASAYECLTRNSPKYSNGQDRVKTHGVVSLIAGGVREIEFLSVVYSPSNHNNAHTNVCGIPPKNPNKSKVRVLLHKMHQLEIQAPLNT